MCHGRCANSAQALGHTYTRIGHLILARLPAQLLYHFDRLIHTCRTDRMSARFQAAHRADWNSALRRDFAIAREVRAAPAFRKPGGF